MMRMINDLKGARAEIRSKVNILKVVTEDLGPAPKQGSQDHMWNCPLHGEKTPSFGVHEGMGIFKCFGCSRGGDVVQWIQLYNNVSLPEALEILSVRYAVDLSQYQREPTQEEKDSARYTKIQNELTKYCSKNLFSNKPLLEWYMSDTGFTLEQIADYDVGYSKSHDDNINHLYSAIQEITEAEINKLEISRKMMWGNALVYPVKNASGGTCRFYNKPLSPPSDFSGKYIGTSSEHPLFSNKLLFGFHNVRKTLTKSSKLLMVEGQKAAIASGGVAILGSSIHDDQIQLVKEYGIKDIVVCFDGDDAGRAASMRFIDDAPKFDDVIPTICKIQEGYQPDSLIKEKGIETFNDVVAAACLPIEYYVNARKESDGLSEQAKVSILRDLKSYLSRLSDVHADLSAKYLAETLDVDISSVKSLIADIKASQNSLYNRDVEMMVVKTALTSPEQWPIIKQAVETSKAFTIMPNQKIYECIDILASKARLTSGSKSVTIQSVKDELAIRYPQYKDLGNYVDMAIASEFKYEFLDALYKVVDLHKRRTAIEQSKLFSALMQDLTRSTSEIVSSYRRNLVSVIDVTKDQSSTPTQLANLVAKELEARSMRKNMVIGHDFSTITDVNGHSIPCLTGLTYATQGIQKQHQFIISAHSGCGKSLLGLQMAASISICQKPADRVPTLWIPLEMNATEITMRAVSMLSGVDNNKVQSANLTKEEGLKVKKALEMISEGKLFMQKPRYGSSEEIMSIIEEYKFKYGVEVVFLDYIQMIASGPSDKGNSREEVIGKCSKMMKLQVAEGMGLSSICISQQNRQNYKQGETTKIESVGGSYQVAQDADEFLTMSEKTIEQMAEDKSTHRGNRKGFLDKRRGGASDVIFDFNLDTVNCSLRFMETITPSELLGLSMGMKN